MDIHWSYQNLLFWAGIVWHRLSANQIVGCFKFKKLKNYIRYQVDFLLPMKLQKLSYYFGLCWKILLANQFAGFFSFDLLILIVGVHCYIVLVLLDWFMWKTRVTQIRWFGKSIVQCIIIRPTHYIQSLKCNILCCIISISRKYEM